MGKRKASNKSAFGVPLGLKPALPGDKVYPPIRVPRHILHKTRTRITTGNRGCNVGGSGLRRLRFGDGRLRNRAVPKLYRTDGSVKG